VSNLIAPLELQSELNRIGSVLYKKKGTFLFAQGDAGIGVFLIRRGKVTLQLDDNVPLYPSCTLGPGAIIGLPATLSSGTYSLAAEITEDAELDFVSRNDFLVMMKSDTNLCLEVMNLLGKEVASIRSALVSFKKKKKTPSSC
jgi:CRP-like cAMP-binding protein